MNHLKTNKIALLACLVLLLSGCADTVDLSACVSGNEAGFFSGLYHGIISPFTFIVGIFDDEVAVYAVNNSGTWYDLGFLIGVGILGGGSSKAKK